MNTSAKKTIAAAIDEVVALARRVVPPKMTAAVLYGSEDLRIEEIDVPSLAADDMIDGNNRFRIAKQSEGKICFIA